MPRPPVTWRPPTSDLSASLPSRLPRPDTRRRGDRPCRAAPGSGRPDRVLEAAAKRHLGGLYAMAARSDEALELVRESSLVLDALNELTFSAVHREVAAEAKELAGDRPGAEQEWLAVGLLQRAREGPRPVRSRDRYHLAHFYCDEGRWDDAERFASLFRDALSTTRNAVWAATMRLAVEARLAAHDDRAAEAVALAEDAVASAETLGVPNDTARIWLALGEVRTSRRPDRRGRRCGRGCHRALRAEGQHRRRRAARAARRADPDLAYDGPCFQAASIAFSTSSIERWPVIRPISFCCRASTTPAFHQVWIGLRTYWCCPKIVAKLGMKLGICPFRNSYWVRPPWICANRGVLLRTREEVDEGLSGGLVLGARVGVDADRAGKVQQCPRLRRDRSLPGNGRKE